MTERGSEELHEARRSGVAAESLWGKDKSSSACDVKTNIALNTNKTTSIILYNYPYYYFTRLKLGWCGNMRRRGIRRKTRKGNVGKRVEERRNWVEEREAIAGKEVQGEG